jgi:hypothetical protein
MARLCVEYGAAQAMFPAAFQDPFSKMKTSKLPFAAGEP